MPAGVVGHQARLRAHGERAAVLRAPAATVASNSAASASGRAASCTATTSTSPASTAARSGARPRHSEACRVGPPVDEQRLLVRAALLLHQPAHDVRVLGSVHDDDAVDVRREQAVRSDHASTGVPSSGSSTLLVVAPTRVPAPAATSTTAVRGRCGVVGQGPSLPDRGSGVTQRYHAP